MLSYMVPSTGVVEEKPPPVPTSSAPVSKGHLQLELNEPQPTSVPTAGLTNGHAPKRIIKTQSKTSTISAESSASSISSVLSEVPGTHSGTPSQDRPKHNKLVTNGQQPKHPTLKRVSFGSSKGSMVETLIYESPLQEEPELSPSADQSSIDSAQGSDSSKASKVRVKFFECEKPHVVSSPEPGDLIDDLDAPIAMSAVINPQAYTRQASTDSGWDNPFRPDGDLSREADEIVELINSGKPITPTPLNGEPPKLPDSNATENGKVPSPAKAATTAASPPNKAANGTKPLSNGDKSSSVATPGGQLELQRSTVTPSDAVTVEHVNLKKKPKCKCCVVQ